MSTLVNYLNSNCKSQWSARGWLDIEGSQYWTSSHSSNQAWYKVSFTVFFYSAANLMDGSCFTTPGKMSAGHKLTH